MFRREASLGHLSTWVARQFVRTLDRRLKPHGISAGHVPVFLSLAEEPRLSQKQLVARGFVEQPAMVATLRRMEKGGLVAREPNPNDGRASLFSLTDKGAALLDTLYGALDHGNVRALTGFDAAEKAQLLGYLRRVIVNMTAEGEASPPA